MRTNAPRSATRLAIAQEYREVVECGQMRTARARLFSVAAVCATFGAAAPGPVATAPPDVRHAELRGACYCRAMGELNCVGVVTQAQCNTQCAEALCDD